MTYVIGTSMSNLARFTRALAAHPEITYRTFPGPNGTLVFHTSDAVS